MEWIGWVLFVLLLFWYFAGLNFSHRKRLHLRNYIVYLLIDDAIREDHKAKFGQWIRQSNERNALQLSSMTNNVIESMADSLASGGSSTLGAHAMLWNSDAAAELRKRHGSYRIGPDSCDQGAPTRVGRSAPSPDYLGIQPLDGRWL
jgi:hypothetical protein